MNLAIDHDRQALMRILGTLVAMAGFSDRRATLPRHLRNAVLRLLRPAESATRRLVIALARGLVVTLALPRQRAPSPSAGGWTAKGRTGGVHGTGRALHSTGIVWPAGMAPPASAPLLRPFSLPLIDPLRDPFARRQTYVPPHRLPRISLPGVSDPRPLPLPPSQDDPIDARRLRLRLEALGAALDDLPGHALRFARWQARQARSRERLADAAQNDGSAKGASTVRIPGRSRRAKKIRWPLRPGRPPGLRKRRRDEVHDILAHAHELAVWALEQPDTS